MPVPTSSLFGLGYLGGLGGEALGRNQQAANSHYTDYFDAFRYQMNVAQQQRELQRIHPGMWKTYSSTDLADVDKHGKTGIESMEEGVRPVVALRREIEGWLPKL